MSRHISFQWLAAARLLWAALLVVLIGSAWLQFDASRVQTDVMGLLPQEERTHESTELLSSIANHSAQTIVVLVQADTKEHTLAAGTALLEKLKAAKLPAVSANADVLAQTIAFLRPYREYFLTAADREFLGDASEAALQRRALKNLYRPFSLTALPWQDDPLGLFNARFQEVFVDPRFGVQGDLLTVVSAANPERIGVVIRIETQKNLSIETDSELIDSLRQARREVEQLVPGVKIAAAGPLIISDAVSAQASRESSMIGLVSAAAIAVLVLLVLRSIFSALWMVAVLGLSFFCAASVVWLTFGGLHLLAVVFGATLLGIAADYVFHYLTELFHHPSPLSAAAHLYRGLGISLITSMVGYSTLFLIPMPVLHQVALFCIVGLASAFFSVLLLVPLVVRARPMAPLTLQLAKALVDCLRLGSVKKQALIVAVAAALCLPGLGGLKSADELRLLNSIPAPIWGEQKTIAQQVFLTSPGQFFVVSGADSDETIARLAQFLPWLEKARSKGLITGYRSGLSLLAAKAVQERNFALVHAANEHARELVQQALKTQIAAVDPVDRQPLTLAVWEKSPAGPLYESFWLSPTQTVVLLAGVTPESLPALAAGAKEFAGVRFINTTGDIRTSLTYWKNATLKILVAAFASMLLFLFLVYRGKALRLMLPTALGILCTAGILGWLSVPLSLFIVLPMVLLLGLGTDYAVLLYAESLSPTKHLSILLAMLSTLLSFGLLSFSATPALHQFGLTLGLGIFLIWFFTMLLRPAAVHSR